MNTEEKISLMFSLTEKQQKIVQNLIEDAKNNQNMVKLEAIKTAEIIAKSIGNDVLNKVKENINKYEINLESLISQVQKANQAIDYSTKKFSYKIISSFVLFAMACIFALFAVSFWLTKEIKEQRNTIAILKESGGDFQLSNCGGKICIKVDETTKYADGYRIIIQE